MNNRKSGQAEASGCLALVKRQVNRVKRIGPLDAAPSFADAALSHDIAHRLLALAAASGHAELELKLIKRIDALGNRGANFPVRDGLANADDHG
jgi:hypothetical protein